MQFSSFVSFYIPIFLLIMVYTELLIVYSSNIAVTSKNDPKTIVMLSMQIDENTEFIYILENQNKAFSNKA